MFLLRNAFQRIFGDFEDDDERLWSLVSVEIEPYGPQFVSHCCSHRPAIVSDNYARLFSSSVEVDEILGAKKPITTIKKSTAVVVTNRLVTNVSLGRHLLLTRGVFFSLSLPTVCRHRQLTGLPRPAKIKRPPLQSEYTALFLSRCLR